MDKHYIWSTIILMSIITYLPRSLPMILLTKKVLPAWFTSWLKLVPTAIFGALVLPDVLLSNNQLALGFNNIALWTTLIITPLALKTKSLAWTLIAGASVFTLLQNTSNQ